MSCRQGSTQWLGFKYAVTAGVVTEDAYPYKSRVDPSTEPCRTGGIAVAGRIANYTRLPANNYSALMNAVAGVGPVAISVDASWMAYEGGIFEPAASGIKTTIDHAVQVVGYGTEGGKDYWVRCPPRPIAIT